VPAGKQLADEGVVDSIPVVKACETGAQKITAILSHPRGYRVFKPPHAFWHRCISGVPENNKLLLFNMLCENQETV
jgi:predicted patatin/cPLA2 family phospholipase